MILLDHICACEEECGYIYIYKYMCVYVCVYSCMCIYTHIYHIHTYYTYTYQRIPPLGPCPVYVCVRERIARDDDTLINTISRKHTFFISTSHTYCLFLSLSPSQTHTRCLSLSRTHTLILSLTLSLADYIPSSLSLSLSLSVFLSVCLSVCRSVCLSVCLSVGLSLFLSPSLSLSLYTAYRSNAHINELYLSYKWIMSVAHQTRPSAPRMNVMSLVFCLSCRYSRLQIGWHRISRFFIQPFQRPRILPMGFTSDKGES